MQLKSMDTRVGLLFLAALMAFPLFFTSGCMPIVVTEREVYASEPPPAHRVEVRTRKPGPRHVWKKGRWVWRARANRYVWIPGAWMRVRHPHHRHWVPGRWVHSSRGYHWRPGHWR